MKPTTIVVNPLDLVRMAEALQPALAPKPTPAQAWEAFLDACERAGWLHARGCWFCEGEPVNGILEHADPCPVSQIDQIVGALR